MKNYIVILLALVHTVAVFAGTDPELLDKKIRYGKLENGLTYYILHNEEPKGKASFYMVQNVGALLEEDHQNGLAHMLEHLAFNGSTHFQGKGIKYFLESNGVQFGSNINAYTNLDETVYNISNIPTESSIVMDSCVWILHDWSGSLTLSGEEIDAERGVINEEWRTRNTPSRRLYDQLGGVRYGDSKYAVRNVIGDMDVINNSEYEAIRSFYRKWYRPDLQAVVIVGDFDAELMEERVKRILSKIPAPVNPAHRTEYPVPDNKEMMFGVATDKEATQYNFSMLIKHPVVPRAEKDLDYLKENIRISLVNSMLNRRFSELTQVPGAPFSSVQAGYYSWIRTKSAFMMSGKIKDNKAEEAIRKAWEEVERARRYGFVPTELERVKSDFLARYKSQFDKRDKISNDSHAKSLQVHYLTGEPRPGIEFYYDLLQEEYEAITVEELNNILDQYITAENRVFTLTGPESEETKYLTQAEVERILAEAESAELNPFQDKVAGRQLIPADLEPVGGEIVKEEPYGPLNGATVYTLSNGAKIVLYTTDNTKNEVLLKGMSKGGISLLGENLLPTAHSFSSIRGMSGLAGFDRISLGKMLTGKNVAVNLSIDDLHESVNGQTEKDDIETLFQLLYLNFKAPRFDEKAVQLYKENYAEKLRKSANNPGKIFADSLGVILSDNHPRRIIMDEEKLASVTLENYRRIYSERFDNIGDFTFFLVGDFEKEEALKFIRLYIGGLPGGGDAETWVNHQIDPPAESVKREIELPMTTPKHTNYQYYYTTDYTYNPENNLIVQIAGRLLKMRYFETMREEVGGTYGTSVNISPQIHPFAKLSISINYDCDPEKSDQLKEIGRQELANLVNDGARKDDFESVKESLLKSREIMKERNGYTATMLLAQYKTGISYFGEDNFENIIRNLDVDTFDRKVKELLDPGKFQYYEISMVPLLNQ